VTVVERPLVDYFNEKKSSNEPKEELIEELIEQYYIL
jgi:hypothetical protein